MGRWIPRFIVVLLILVSSLPLLRVGSADPPPPERRQSAIEFPADLPWINVTRPLRLADLAGRVVLLDFWTYGCINCLHIVEDLRRLEARYGDALVVIGVHSPKFERERSIEGLRQIVLRLEREHPVVNDVDMRLWERYGVRAWPTLVVIDPQGRIVGKVAGEGHYATLEAVIGQLIRAAGTTIAHGAPGFVQPERWAMDEHSLAFPGAVAVSGDRVAVSDTLHHRVVIATRDGRVERVVGGPAAGFAEGDAGSARFRAPQGLLFADTALYVADTGNHAVRRIDLAQGRVTTLAGTGRIADGPMWESDPRRASLRSPWALALDGHTLYVAMAGSHQIWTIDLQDARLDAYAGTGGEGLRDGALARSEFSQPSALALAGDRLYIADPEASAVRVIDRASARVTTLVGTGLFDFGDRDGPFERALLQHPLGIATDAQGAVWVADTYNHRIRRLDVATRTVRSVIGDGTAGRGTGAAATSRLHEPSGIAVDDRGWLWIADTNNHRILRSDPGRTQVEEWEVRWGESPVR